jgi:tripartite-type tricarboxylate transporter receptor subunit TctC
MRVEMEETKITKSGLKKSACLFGAALAVVTLSWPAMNTAKADSVANFYKGKQITVVVGYGPGGGYDTYMRLLARHMPQHIPGHPRIVIQNMPGAGSLRAANHIANVAPKDGTALGVFGAPAALEPLFGNKKAQFETLKFAWIGNMLRDVASCATWYNSGIHSLNDIIHAKTPVVFAATGAGSYGNQHALVLKHMLHANLRVITGFKGLKDVGLALQRKEAQMACAVFVSTAKTAFRSAVEKGQLKFIVQFGKENVPYFGNAPNFRKMLKTDEDRQVANLFFDQVSISRPLIGPPGMPAEIIAALRKAMMDTLKDKALLADAAKAKLDIDPVSGEETAKMMASFYKAPRAVVARAKQIMGRK